jgi:1,4-dihydroxy-2-naphthoate octaprenyltransferase
MKAELYSPHGLYSLGMSVEELRNYSLALLGAGSALVVATAVAFDRPLTSLLNSYTTKSLILSSFLLFYWNR